VSAPAAPTAAALADLALAFVAANYGPVGRPVSVVVRLDGGLDLMGVAVELSPGAAATPEQTRGKAALLDVVALLGPHRPPADDLARPDRPGQAGHAARREYGAAGAGAGRSATAC